MKKYFLLLLLSMVTCQGVNESTNTDAIADSIYAMLKEIRKDGGLNSKEDGMNSEKYLIGKIKALIGNKSKKEVNDIVKKFNCKSSFSLLTIAIYGNCVKILNFLIEKGVEINGKNITNKTALDNALYMQQIKNVTGIIRFIKNYNMANYKKDNEAIISLLAGEDKEETMKLWNSERKRIALVKKNQAGLSGERKKEKNNGSPETETSSTLSNTNIFIIVVLVLAVLSFIVYLYSENSRSEAVKKLKKRK